MGDPNASIPTPQPVFMRPMFAAMGGACGPHSIAFVSSASLQHGMPQTYGLSKRIEPVKNCRGIGKRDMRLNDAMPAIEVDAETYRVTADGEHLVSSPASSVNLAQRYFLF